MTDFNRHAENDGDDSWAAPAWQVDSATRTCCGGIGGHTPNCEAVPRPADAARVGDWEDLDGTGDWQRHFSGTRHHNHLQIIGLQRADGTITRCVGVHVHDVLTPTAARELAGALLAAATDADQLD